MSVSPSEFRQALSRFPSGVTVVTSVEGATPVGITVSAFSSVSAEPPLVLICIGKKSGSHDVIARAGKFAVSILGRGQKQLGAQFAGMVPGVEDRFSGVETATARTGAPYIVGAQAWLDCELHQQVDAGDHSVFLGRVLACDSVESGEPLMYFNRDWRTISSDPV